MRRTAARLFSTVALATSLVTIASGTTVDFGRTERPLQTGDLTAGWIRQHGAADIQSHGSQFLPGDWCGAITRI